MKILLAPDSFKGCLTAREVADALAVFNGEKDFTI